MACLYESSMFRFPPSMFYMLISMFCVPPKIQFPYNCQWRSRQRHRPPVYQTRPAAERCRRKPKDPSMRTPMTASDASAFPLRRYGGVRCRLIFHPSYSSTGYPDARRCACLRPHSVTTKNTRGEARHGAGARIGLRPGRGRDGSRWRLDARRMTAEAGPLQDDCGGRTRRAFSRNSPRRFPVRAEGSASRPSSWPA